MDKINTALISHHPGIKEDIQVVRLKKDTVSELHTHDCIQILHILKGYGEVTTEDGTWVIPQNQGILIPPGKAHYLDFTGSVETNNIFINSSYNKNLSSSDCFVFNLSNLVREIIDYFSKLKNFREISEPTCPTAYSRLGAITSSHCFVQMDVQFSQESIDREQLHRDSTFNTTPLRFLRTPTGWLKGVYDPS